MAGKISRKKRNCFATPTIIFNMKRILFFAIFIGLFSCSDNEPHLPDGVRILSIEDIKREYAIADSLNYMKDRTNIDTATIILGIDERNGRYIERVCMDRGFGCILFSDFYTILYQNCDSFCCKRSGRWIIDSWGIAGFSSPVGCEPDTTSSN